MEQREVTAAGHVQPQVLQVTGAAAVWMGGNRSRSPSGLPLKGTGNPGGAEVAPLLYSRLGDHEIFLIHQYKLYLGKPAPFPVEFFFRGGAAGGI